MVQWASQSCEYVDNQLTGMNPCQIVMVTAVALVVLYYVLQITISLFKFLTDFGKIKTKLFRLAMYIPQVKREIEKEQNKVIKDCT